MREGAREGENERGSKANIKNRSVWEEEGGREGGEKEIKRECD